MMPPTTPAARHHGNGRTGTTRQAAVRRRLVWAAAASVMFLGLAASTLWRRPVDPGRLWAEVQADVEAKRLDRAEDGLRDLAGRYSDDPRYRVLRAEVDAARGRDASALAHLAAVPDSHPLASRGRALAGNLELARSQAREAERQWSRAVALDPDRIEARRNLAYLYALQLRKAEFDAQFRAIAGRWPVTYAVAHFWTQINCSIYDPNEAAGRLERFVSADPGDRASRLALVEAYLRLERVADAERLLGALPAGDDDARAARARVALLRGDEPSASALLARGPADHAGLARVRGRLALTRHDFPAAARHYRAALASDPLDHDATEGLARALRMLDDGRGAAVCWERARLQSRLWDLAQQSARNQDAAADLGFLRDLGKACEAAGRGHEARAWFNLVVERDPLDREAQLALHRLPASDRR